MKTIRTLISLFLNLIGAIVATISTLDHLRYKLSGSLSHSFCNALVKGGCYTAHASRFSEVFGIPISLLGLSFYLGNATYLIYVSVKKQKQDTFYTLLLGLAALSIIYCAFLAYILYKSGNFCPLCVSMYLVNIGLFALALWVKIRDKNWGINFRVVVYYILIYLIFLGGSSGLYEAKLSKFKNKKVEYRVVAVAKKTKDQKVRIIEISDLLCPYCKRFYFTLKQVEKKYKNKVNVSFLNYPLDSCNKYVGRAFHPSACISAIAVLCAKKQGKMWQYLDLLYSEQHRHNKKELLSYAKRLGLDTRAFLECMDSKDTQAQLMDQIERAHGFGVKATPSFILDNRLFVGAVDEGFIERRLNPLVNTR